MNEINRDHDKKYKMFGFSFVLDCSLVYYFLLRFNGKTCIAIGEQVGSKSIQ